MCWLMTEDTAVVWLRWSLATRVACLCGSCASPDQLLPGSCGRCVRVAPVGAGPSGWHMIAGSAADVFLKGSWFGLAPVEFWQHW